MTIRVSKRATSDADLASSFLQSDFWGDFKAEYGWTALRLELEARDGLDALGEGRRVPLLLLVNRLPASLSFAYIPLGPELEPLPEERASFLAELSEKLRPFLPKRCLFLRFDPPWRSVEVVSRPEGGASSRAIEVEAARPALGLPLRRAVVDVQPPDTVVVDLRPSEEAILAAMKAKWRYNVRYAEKKGVIVEEAGEESVPVFYALNRLTAARDRIALRSEGYYSRLFSLASERRDSRIPGAPDLRLWIAKYEGRAIAANITLFRGEEAVYLYGASSDEERRLMPTYALQWAAMRAAKRAGCVKYDLYGIPPTDDPEHPMAGLYRFKTGFGGEIAHRAGSWDLPLMSVAYRCFRAAESARAWWFKSFMKRLKKSRKP
jgi:lipid II:glycine glycyltransferase (peptidoglycan interpeptide bridge formation enzyme)